MEKNMPKYYSYKNAYERINNAVSSGFYLEAITIEESIFADRLYRFCKDHGIMGTAERTTLGGELGLFRKLNIEVLRTYKVDFLSELERFWKNRNICLHQIVKSEPGTPTMEYGELTRLAEVTAQEGKLLVKRVSKWSERYKENSRKYEKAIDEPIEKCMNLTKDERYINNLPKTDPEN